MPEHLVFLGKQQVACESVTLPGVTADQVRVQSICSLVSTGTENIVFNRLFDAGTHWDNWVKYPFKPGYSLIGEVVEVGAGVTTLSVGDRVALRHGHASEAIQAAADCVKVPAGLDPRQAAWFALAKIAFMGARAANFRLGDDVLIIGAGPIGQMALRWVRAIGARSIVVIDTVPMRLDLAKRGGATATFAKTLPAAQDEVIAATGGRRPRVVIDTTGNAQVLQGALAVVRDRGRVVILGDTGSPGGQHLTSDVITRGIEIVGAHDCHNDAEWHGSTIAELFFQFAVDGRFNLSGLETHVFAPRDCVHAYETMNTKRGETMGVIFDWRGK